MGNQNYIVINGKKYDAVTGKQLQSSDAPRATIETITNKKPAGNVGVVDGFTRPKKSSNSHTSVNHASKKPQKSQTLARKAVHKPDSITPKVKPAHPGISKNSLGTSPRRAYMAKEVHKSPQIHKYGAESTRTSVVKKNVQAPVKPPPSYNTTNRVNPTNTQVQKATSNVHPKSKRSEQMIERALANANSHNQQPPVTSKKKRSGRFTKKLGISRKTLTISSAVLAVTLLVGFYALQNIPNISMRIAATRAGFDAHMPAYTPSGFAFKGPINYEPGRVTITYKANADDRSYALTQQASNWNSDALVANFIEPENKQYQTYLDRGRTLYIYDGSNATWIDDGVWYQIEGQSGMTTDQLIRLAASI